MGGLWQRFNDFLGSRRRTALFILLAVTGLLSLILNVVQGQAGVVAIQTGLFLVFIGGTVVIIFSALEPYERGRWIGILVPSFLLVVLGMMFFPQQAGLFMGLAFGWIIAALFLFRPREPISRALGPSPRKLARRLSPNAPPGGQDYKHATAPCYMGRCR